MLNFWNFKIIMYEIYYAASWFYAAVKYVYEKL